VAFKFKNSFVEGLRKVRFDVLLLVIIIVFVSVYDGMIFKINSV